MNDQHSKGNSSHSKENPSHSKENPSHIKNLIDKLNWVDGIFF